VRQINRVTITNAAASVGGVARDHEVERDEEPFPQGVKAAGGVDAVEREALPVGCPPGDLEVVEGVVGHRRPQLLGRRPQDEDQLGGERDGSDDDAARDARSTDGAGGHGVSVGPGRGGPGLGCHRHRDLLRLGLGPQDRDARFDLRVVRPPA
jgi:hypothetical protein